MNDKNFAQYLMDVREQARAEHRQRWKEWIPNATKNISEAMGRLLGMSAELARATARKDPATELLTLEPQMTDLLHDCYQLLGDIQGNLCVAEMLLDKAPSTSISPT